MKKIIDLKLNQGTVEVSKDDEGKYEIFINGEKYDNSDDKWYLEGDDSILQLILYEVLKVREMKTEGLIIRLLPGSK